MTDMTNNLIAMRLHKMVCESSRVNIKLSVENCTDTTLTFESFVANVVDNLEDLIQDFEKHMPLDDDSRTEAAAGLNHGLLWACLLGQHIQSKSIGKASFKSLTDEQIDEICDLIDGQCYSRLKHVGESEH